MKVLIVTPAPPRSRSGNRVTALRWSRLLRALGHTVGIAQEFGGHCNLRFDDTDPTKEDTLYVEAIKDNIRWLGFDWGDNLYNTSDYFDKLYQFALQLIECGSAYVCSLTEAEIRETRGTVTKSRHESPYRTRRVDEN